MPDRSPQLARPPTPAIVSAPPRPTAHHAPAQPVVLDDSQPRPPTHPTHQDGQPDPSQNQNPHPRRKPTPQTAVGPSRLVAHRASARPRVLDGSRPRPLDRATRRSGRRHLWLPPGGRRHDRPSSAGRGGVLPGLLLRASTRVAWPAETHWAVRRSGTARRTRRGRPAVVARHARRWPRQVAQVRRSGLGGASALGFPHPAQPSGPRLDPKAGMRDAFPAGPRHCPRPMG